MARRMSSGLAAITLALVARVLPAQEPEPPDPDGAVALQTILREIRAHDDRERHFDELLAQIRSEIARYEAQHAAIHERLSAVEADIKTIMQGDWRSRGALEGDAAMARRMDVAESRIASLATRQDQHDKIIWGTVAGLIAILSKLVFDMVISRRR